MAEAEYMELAKTAKQAAWLRSFSQEIGRSPTHPTTICADNQAAIFLATNPAQQTRDQAYGYSILLHMGTSRGPKSHDLSHPRGG